MFDHKALKAYWTSGLTNVVKVIGIDADTRDVLTLTYYMRPKARGSATEGLPRSG